MEVIKRRGLLPNLRLDQRACQWLGRSARSVLACGETGMRISLLVLPKGGFILWHRLSLCAHEPVVSLNWAPNNSWLAVFSRRTARAVVNAARRTVSALAACDLVQLYSRRVASADPRQLECGSRQCAVHRQH